MKFALVFASALIFCSLALRQGKVLTSDPLTGLPLLPANELEKKFGNAPTKMPDGVVCQSKMKGDFYKLYDYFAKDNMKFADAVTWYGSHLSGFKKVEAGNHLRTIFYSGDGSNVVIVTAESHAADGAVKARSVSYERYDPGISEKTIISLTGEHIACK